MGIGSLRRPSIRTRAEYMLLLSAATEQAELTIIEWKEDVDETLRL
jgi:hypothetical protein